MTDTETARKVAQSLRGRYQADDRCSDGPEGCGDCGISFLIEWVLERTEETAQDTVRQNPTRVPRVGEHVIYRTDGRNGLTYDLPAVVTVIKDSHPGDYPCETCEGMGQLPTGVEHYGAQEMQPCPDCDGSGKGALNPLPIPSSPMHVHLTVFTPGGFGTEVTKGTLTYGPPDDSHFVDADSLIPGSGTYVELDVPFDNKPFGYETPRSWRWPE